MASVTSITIVYELRYCVPSELLPATVPHFRCKANRQEMHGEPAGTRTRDHRIKSAMLYQLSYRPKRHFGLDRSGWFTLKNIIVI